MKQHRVFNQPVLEEQDRRQQYQGQRDNREFEGAIPPQLLPGGLVGNRPAIVARRHARHRRRGAAGNAVGAGYLLYRFVDRTGQYHGGNGGAGDAVYTHITRSSLGADPDLVGALLTFELVDELLQVGIGDADHENRFLVMEDVHAFDQSVLPECYHRVDWFA